MHIGIGWDCRGRGYGFSNAEASAYVAAMTVQPNRARKSLIDTYIGALKTAGVYAKLDWGYLLAAQTSQAARLNFKAPGSFACVDVGAGPAFVADRGFTGDGVATALSTQWVPSTNGVQFTQDNASMWVWATTDIAENMSDVGAAITHNSFIRARSAGNAISITMNGATTSTNAIGTAIGLTGASRADAVTQRIWKNGVEQGSGFAGASTGLPTAAVRICGRATDLFATKQVAFAAAGASLSAGEALALYNATLAYLVGVGAA